MSNIIPFPPASTPAPTPSASNRTRPEITFVIRSIPSPPGRLSYSITTEDDALFINGEGEVFDFAEIHANDENMVAYMVAFFLDGSDNYASTRTLIYDFSEDDRQFTGEVIASFIETLQDFE